MDAKAVLTECSAMSLTPGIRKRITRMNQVIRAHKNYLKEMELSLAALKLMAREVKLKKRLRN